MMKITVKDKICNVIHVKRKVYQKGRLIIFCLNVKKFTKWGHNKVEKISATFCAK